MTEEGLGWAEKSVRAGAGRRQGHLRRRSWEPILMHNFDQGAQRLFYCANQGCQQRRPESQEERHGRCLRRRRWTTAP